MLEYIHQYHFMEEKKKEEKRYKQLQLKYYLVIFFSASLKGQTTMPINMQATAERVLEDTATTSTAATKELPYGFLPNIQSVAPSAPKATPLPVSMTDRTTHSEARLVSFIAEHNLPLSIDKDSVPWGNLISMLSDSASIMRGKQEGLETLLRKTAPQLLDIDGDVCHHVHNITKKLCSHFRDLCVERLLDDVYHDFLYSTDLRAWLKEVCGILNLPYHVPKERMPHRWLSVCDCMEKVTPMMSALKVLYSAWLQAKERKDAYNEEVKDIVKDVKLQNKKKLDEIKQKCVAKYKTQYMTPQGKDREKRIIRKI